jgi:hypothetical protein
VATIEIDLLADHVRDDLHSPIVGEQVSPPATANGAANPKPFPPSLAEARLAVYADALDDFEAFRQAAFNRMDALTRPEEKHGRGWDVNVPEVAEMIDVLADLRKIEDRIVRKLEKTMAAHPLGPWVQTQVGIGLKQGGRLVAAVGDPYWNAAADRPRRGPAELWAYCGYHVLHLTHKSRDNHEHSGEVDLLGPDQSAAEAHIARVGADLSDTADQWDADIHTSTVGGVAPRRQRGQKANWNGMIRSRAWLVATSCIKFTGNGPQRRSPYRDVYEAGRAKYADSVHKHLCMNRSRFNPNGCGTREHPEWGAIGSPLRPGHQDARALRLVAKQILTDLFLEARHLHEEGLWA